MATCEACGKDCDKSELDDVDGLLICPECVENDTYDSSGEKD